MSFTHVGRGEAAVASATVPADRLLPGIHGLRGIAAVAVVVFHIAAMQINVPPILNFIQVDFAKGVYLFFVLSSFSLMHSTVRHTPRPQWITIFFVKRFCRIAPLFYFVLMVVLGWSWANHQLIDPWQVILNIGFATGFSPQQGLVPAGWTVGVEMLFYAVFPVLLLSIRSTKAALLVAVASIPLTCASRVVFFRTDGEWFNFMFPSNLCFFAFGLLAYHLVHQKDIDDKWTRVVAPIFAALMILILFQLDNDNALRRPPGMDTVLWGIGLAALCVWQGRASLQRGSRILHYLGERSYSIYLLHPLVLRALRDRLQSMHSALLPLGDVLAFVACAGAVLAVLLILCEATYRLIELPGIGLGARLNRKLTMAAQ